MLFSSMAGRNLKDTYTEAVEQVLKGKEYPFINTCLGKYIRYILAQCDPSLFFIIEFLQNCRVEKLESLLRKVACILKMGPEELVQNFGINSDLITPEPDKFYDIYDEFGTVSRLQEEGFDNIKKIRKPAQDEGRYADFTAYCGSDKYAIEVKTIRRSEIENRARIGLPSRRRDPFKIDDLRNLLKSKLKDILPSAQEQLRETAEREKCNKNLAAIWVERKAARVLLGLRQDDYGKIYDDIKSQFPEIDYFLFNGNKWCPERSRR